MNKRILIGLVLIVILAAVYFMLPQICSAVSIPLLC